MAIGVAIQSGKPENLALFQQIHRKIARPHEPARGKFDGLAAIENGRNDVRCKKAQASKPREFPALRLIEALIGFQDVPCLPASDKRPDQAFIAVCGSSMLSLIDEPKLMAAPFQCRRNDQTMRIIKAAFRYLQTYRLSQRRPVDCDFDLCIVDIHQRG